MKIDQQFLVKLLTYSGTLPLIGSVLLIFYPIIGLNSVDVATKYSAIIISFLCGIHWGVQLFFSEKCPKNLFIRSNIVALLAWVSVLIEIQIFALSTQILCFLYLLWLDKIAEQAGIIPNWFFHLRKNASLIVINCLLCVLLLA